ncbi:MAG: FlgD immunoglobulin-like domain containing protein [Candidatus Eisenbacteria bacterium]
MKRAFLLLALSAFGLPSAAAALLPAPTGATASVDSCWGIRVSWDLFPEADSFYVSRDSTVFYTEDNFFRDAAAPAGSVFYFVAGIDSTGIGESASATGFRPVVPEPPATLVASDTSCALVRLDWSASVEADSYAVFRNGTEIIVLSASSLSYEDAPPPGEYEYAVRAANGCGRSAPATDSGTVFPVSVPPATVTASMDSCGFIRLDWSSVPYTITYRVRRDGAFLVALPGTALRDSTAAPGPHTYEVRSVGPCGSSAFSAPIQGVRPPDAPPPPVGVSASDDLCDHVFLQWSLPADTDSFRVSRNGALLATVPAAVLAYRDTVPAGEYEYGVEAGNPCGWSGAAVDSARVPPPPAAPPFLTATDTLCGRVDLAWGASAAVDTYVVFRDSTEIASVLPPALAWSDTNGSGSHEYLVLAATPCGRSAAAADSGNAFPAPGAPLSLAATDTICGRVDLSWEAAADADTYVVFRDGAEVAALPAPAGSWSDDTVTGVHVYGVSGANGCGRSAAVLDSGTAVPAPVPPSGLAASTDSCGLVRVEWTAAPFDTGYVIYRDSVFLAEVPAASPFYRDTGAAVGANTYWVGALGLCGRSDSVSAAGERPPDSPPAPAIVDASDMVCGAVAIVWGAVPGADSFHVYRDSLRIASTGGDTTWTDTPPPGAYLYEVEAVGICGAGPRTGDEGTRPPDSPDVPDGVAASDTVCGAVRVTWAPVEGGVEYRVLRDGAFLAATDTTVFDDDGTVPAISHLYSVIAAGLCGESAESDTARGVRPPDPPLPPAGLSATRDRCDGVFLTWPDGDDEEGYLVFRDSVLIDSLDAGETAYLDTSIAAGVSAEYRIAAWNGCALLPELSAPDSGLAIPPPGGPAAVEADSACGGITLRWTDGPWEEGYFVVRDSAVIDSLGADEAEYFDGAVEPGESHVYFVGAFNGCSALPAYSDSARGARPYDAPETPQILSVTDDLCGGIEVRWSRADHADDYVLYRNGVPIATIPWTDLYHRDLTAAPGVLYTYQVDARNWCGASPRSEAAAGTRPPDAPPAPSNPAASDSSCRFILVTWSDGANETGYRVYRDGAPSPLADLGPNVTEYKDQEVASGSHSYRIEAWNGCGGNRSDPVTGERDVGVPDSPADVAATDGGCDEVTITWSYPSDLMAIDSFRVSFRVTGAGPNWTRLGLVDPGGALRYVHAPAPGTYDYRVLAFDECGGSAETDGAVDTGTRLGPPGVPDWVGAAAIEVCGGETFRLEWNPVEGATGYVVVEEGSGREDRVAGTFFETARAAPGIYTYRVFAEGVCGEGPAGDPRNVEVQPAPAPPDGVEASGDLCGAIEIVWSAGPASDVWVEPAGGARFYMSDMESWVDSLPAGGPREYVIGGWNACGTLAPSDTVAGYALPLGVAAPESVSATGGCDSVVIAWDYPSDGRAAVDTFVVERIRGFSVAVIARIPAADTLRVVDTTGVSGQSYLYRVRALSRCGVSAASSDSGSAVSRPPVPSWTGAPAGACAGVPFILRWEEIPGVSVYEIERDGEADTTVAETEVSRRIDEIGAHLFVVRARNECGLGGAGDPWTVTISRAPSPPAAVAIDTTACDEVVVSWAAQPDSVRIYRSGTGPPVLVFQGPGDGRFTDEPGGAVTYSVRPYNGCGESGGVAVSVTRIRTRPPAPVSVIATNASCDSVVVEWAVPATGTPIDGFQVVRSRNDTTIVVAPALSGSARRFVDRAGEGTYLYEVVAFNECGPSTGNATSRDEGGFLPPIPGSAFDGRSDSIACAGGSFTLRWSGDPGVLSYRLFETTGGVDRLLALLGGTVDSAVVTAGTAGTRTFQVQAVGVCGTGGRSAPFSVAVIAPPTAPPGLTATTDRCGEILLTWTTPPGAAARYRIERDGAAIATVEAPETGYADGDVIEGVEYVYAVFTENFCGLSAAGGGATGRARAGLAAPAPAGPEDGAEGLPIPVLLSWEAVGGAAGYALRVEEAPGGAVVVDTAIGNVTKFSVSGLALGGGYRWRVATRSLCGTGVPSAWRRFTTFGLAPAALASTPADGEIEVDVDVVIRVTFSVPVNGATIGAAALTAAGVAVAGDRSLEGGGSVLVFEPASFLRYGETYLFDYSGLEDVFGRSFEDLPPLTFTTKPAERPFGDMDGNYRRDLADVDLALAFLLGETDPSVYPIERIDLNGDGRFTVADLVLLAGVIVREGMSGPAARAAPLLFEARSRPAEEPGRTRVVLSFDMAEGGRCGFLEIDLGGGAGVLGVAALGVDEGEVDVRYGSSGGRLRVLVTPAGPGSPFVRSDALLPRLEILTAGGEGPERIRLETMTWIGTDGTMRSFRTGGAPVAVAREGALLLAPNRPNPFNPVTELAYYLPAPARVRLVVYDPAGRAVATLREGAEGAGWRSARWDGLTDLGGEAASGIYFARLETEEGVRTVRMILVR